MVTPATSRSSLVATLLQPAPLRAGLLLLWFAVSFGGVYFARDLESILPGGALAYWFSAQGALLLFLLIVVAYAWLSNRTGQGRDSSIDLLGYDAYKRRLHRLFAIYVACLLLFLGVMALAEWAGLSRQWLGALFLFATLILYAGVGIHGRTVNAAEYYVAGRRIPAMYNGMATAADWMSAASFISMAGGLYLQGFGGSPSQPGGLAYLLGWTGGFCLVALLVAPQLRRMELYTIPDFFQVRYGGKWPRRMAALAAIACSFTYVVAQIYGVGLITSRLTGVRFEIGILLGLGGVLVCSFLGGMRAVTWTQVTQYVIIVLAFMVPVSWLAYKQLGNPAAPLVYGKQLAKISEMEEQLNASASEREVIQEYARRAREYEAKLKNVERSLQRERNLLQERLHLLREARAGEDAIYAVQRELALLPADPAAARERWTKAMLENQQRAGPLAGMPSQVRAFAGDPAGSPAEREAYELSRRNFLALMFCLMIGTAGLPHLLMRFNTTPTVAEARNSVAWALGFIVLLYVSVPALAVLVKFEVLSQLVGQRFEALPAWMGQWSRVDATLLSIQDVNRDHVLQFSELTLGADLIMLVTPELGGLPYVVSGLVAAGGLAAALSTADGLLLTIGNALAHDLVPPAGAGSHTGTMHRVIFSKFALLVTALMAAYVAALKSADILNLVSASFSLAGAAFVPAMVLGIFWRGTTRAGAVAGMLAGLAVTVYYMAINAPAVRTVLGLRESGLWFGIQPVSAGLFGVAAGVAVTLTLSLLTRAGRAPAEDRQSPL